MVVTRSQQQQEREQAQQDKQQPPAIYLPSLSEVDLGWFQGLRNGEYGVCVTWVGECVCFGASGTWLCHHSRLTWVEQPFLCAVLALPMPLLCQHVLVTHCRVYLCVWSLPVVL